MLAKHMSFKTPKYMQYTYMIEKQPNKLRDPFKTLPVVTMELDASWWWSLSFSKSSLVNGISLDESVEVAILAPGPGAEFGECWLFALCSNATLELSVVGSS